MATFNLVRNSRVLFTTNVSAGTGLVATSGFSATNAQELQVLDGFTFTQSSNAETINISEAGATPVRGQRSFNTSLGNVEFSFSTYIRPYLNATVKAEESHLWNALLSNTAIGATPASAATTITAVTLVAGLVTITGTGFTPMTVGETVVVKGVLGLGASQFNTAVKIVTSSATSITAIYATNPAAAVSAANWTSAVTFNRTAWNENIAVAADLVATPGIPVAYSEVTTATSNKNLLLPFGMVITVDSITYVIDNCALDQAVVDFGLDGIATVAWTGKGTALRQLATNVSYTGTGVLTLTGGLTGTATGKNTAANFITNKLSTVTMKSNIGGIGGTSYNLALTGGSITIANNITYITPANLGVVNLAIGYYTGTRAISGSMTAYLRTGSTNSAGLLSQLLADSATTAGVEPKFKLQIEIGGAASGTRVEIMSDGAFLQIPTIDAQAVMSTTINFTAQGTEAIQSATSTYDIENTNDLEVRYFSL
jgi:hypothetical protein